MELVEQADHNLDSYFFKKYQGSMPDAILKAKIEYYKNNALSKAKDKNKSNTFVSSSMGQLNRDSRNYANDVHIPEQQAQLNTKIRSWVDNQEYITGEKPSITDISKEFGISRQKSKSYITTGSATAESEFAGSKKYKNFSIKPAIDALPKDEKTLATNIYIHNMPASKAIKEGKLSRTSYFRKKKAIDEKIRNHFALENF